MNAREAARDLIKFYVLRGDSYESLKESWMGVYGRQYRAGIGSGGHATYCPSKGNDSITVSWLEGEQVCFHYSLRELFDEIKNGVEQPSLF